MTIKNDIIGVTLRAMLKNAMIQTTRDGNPVVSIAAYVVDATDQPVLDDDGTLYWNVYLAKKTGDVNTFAVNSLYHVFPQWDGMLQWFERQFKSYADHWVYCTLKTYTNDKGVTKYQIDQLFPFNGQPYSEREEVDVDKLAAIWNQKIKQAVAAKEAQTQAKPKSVTAASLVAKTPISSFQHLPPVEGSATAKMLPGVPQNYNPKKDDIPF